MLINSTDQLREYLPASVNLSFNDIRPKLKLVERDTIKRIFSKEIYNAVLPTTVTGDIADLKDLLAEATAHLGLLSYISFGSVHLDSAGIRIAVNENMKQAFEWQIEDLKLECSNQGWSAVENAIELLENTTETDLKTIYEQSKAYQTAQKTLLPTLKSFEKYVSLNRSRVMFQKFVPIIQDIQDDLIIPTLGKDLFTKIREKTTYYTEVNKRASKALAFLSMGTALLDTLLILSDNGPIIVDNLFSRSLKSRRSAPPESIQHLAEAYKTRGQGALKELVDYCQENHENLQEYTTSKMFIPVEQEEKTHIYRNDPQAGATFF